MKKKYFIDLFSGCGGLSLGALKSGFTGLFALEYQPNAFDTFKHNILEKDLSQFGMKNFEWPEELEKKNFDISSFIKDNHQLLLSYKNKVDLIVGGPPCQGFSNMGKRKKLDPRNQLYKSYLDIVDIVKPKMILIENVSGIAAKFNNKGKAFSDSIIKNLSKDYHIKGELINSNLFGVPQNRRRYIIIGVLKNNNNKININDIFNEISNSSKSFTENYKVGNRSFNLSNVNSIDALSDLDGSGLNSLNFQDENASQKRFFKTFKYKNPSTDYQKLLRLSCDDNLQIDSHRIGNHFPDKINMFRGLIKISKEKKPFSANKFSPEEFLSAGWTSKKIIIHVIRENEKSPTLTTCPYDYIHYSSPRILTVREFARLQSFPDWFEFKGIYATSGSLSYTAPRYTQIGNSVPPLMAEGILSVLKKII